MIDKAEKILILEMYYPLACSISKEIKGMFFLLMFTFILPILFTFSLFLFCISNLAVVSHFFHCMNVHNHIAF